MFELNQDSKCVYCGKPAFIRALVSNDYDTISYDFVCNDCIKEREIELGFQTHSGD